MRGVYSLGKFIRENSWAPLEGMFKIGLFASFFLTGSISAQSNPQPPIVRGAFVINGGKISREVRLTDHVVVVLCKWDFDSWVQSQRTVPGMALYMAGRKVTKSIPTVLLPLAENLRKEPALSAVGDKCAEANPNAIALEATARATEAQAKEAISKASESPEKVKAAQSAREQADAAWKAAREIDGFDYYVDPALVTNPDTRDSWLDLLRGPWKALSVAISAGPDGAAWPTEATISFKRINCGWLAAWAVLFLFAVTLFVRYALNSDIIRDTGTLPADASTGSKKAYSLARTQMAIWTFLIAGSLAFIFMVTWNENVISAGILVLMGLSFGTTVLAAVADGTEPIPQVSKGFFNDLLSDGTGPSFHRYQMVLFTVILVLIFVVKVAANLVMPEFDSMLLGLMGISNGTYLGFKLQGR